MRILRRISGIIIRLSCDLKMKQIKKNCLDSIINVQKSKFEAKLYNKLQFQF